MGGLEKGKCKMLNKEDLNLLKVIKEKNLVSPYVIRNPNTAEAFLKCLEQYNWEEEFFKSNLEDFAKYAEEDLRNYVFKITRESFKSPYREIMQMFYKFSNKEMAELEKKFEEALLF